MTKKIVFAGLFLATILTVAINSCKKDSTTAPLEAVSIVQPDTLISTHFGGDSVPLEVKFTTDRPINWVLGVMQTDTSGAANFNPVYPDTFFFRNLTLDTPRTNLYTFDSLYFIPDTLKAYSVIYFNFSFEAGSNGFTAGQNYPPGITRGNKSFKINTR